jgi:hypothetical protein
MCICQKVYLKIKRKESFLYKKLDKFKVQQIVSFVLALFQIK